MASEYEDKYLLLRDENTALKKKKNEQEATIKRMFTKMAIIEESLKKKRQADGKSNQEDSENEGNKAAVMPVRRDLDTEKFVASLKSENALLRKKNQVLMEKNRWLEEHRRHTNSTKRGVAPRATTQTKRPPPRNAATISNSSGGFVGDSLGKQTESARNLHRETFSGDLEVALKKRLVIAEKQLVKLQQQNEKLSSSRLQLKPRRDNNAGSSASDDEDDNNAASTKLESEQMKRELRDRQAQLAILNARYENLEANALAEREIQEKTLAQMEQMNRQVHKLRTKLQDALMEKEDMEIRLNKAGDQEKDIASLREQNRRLEERMTSLCESPFINDAFQRKERIDKLFDLEKLTQEQKATISHMTEENQKLQSIIRDLQSSIKQLKQAKDRVEQDLEQMAHHLMEERNARNLDAIKSSAGSATAPRPEPLIIIRSQTPELPVHGPLPEKRDACSSPVHNSVSPAPTSHSANVLNIAGSMVRRKYGDLSNFLDKAEGEDDSSVKHLRNRLHVLQIAHLKSMQELERCEKMLQAQTNINRELALEIEELTAQKISGSNQLQRRMKELELISEERQQRIHVLQAEIRQLKYAREKLLLKVKEDDGGGSDGSSSGDEDSEITSLSESLILASRDLAPGEQLLELGIVNGNFDSHVVGVNSSTFVLCEFYDFESQTTPLLMGSRPEYNLSATFKVTADGFFLRYLASESVVLEVYQSVRGDFKLIGKASVRLSKLLQSKGVVKEPTLAVKSINAAADTNTTTLGTLNVVLRLSTPISEIWQAHLRSYPQDIQLISSGGKTIADVPTDVLGGVDLDDHADRATNELQITIFACRNLRSYGKRKNNSLTRVPSPYAHYQLLGFPDVFTDIVSESRNPEFDLNSSRQAFTLDVDACLLRFFSKFRFWVTVFDDKVELDGSVQEEGVVGRCGIMLSNLVNGDSIRGWFPLKDQNDQHAGDISILIEWKDPFQVLQLISSQRARGVNGRPIDLHSLDFDQQHAILSMFSAERDGKINYQQFLHYAAPSEGLELVAAKLKERVENAIDSGHVSSAQDVFTNGKLRKTMVVSVANLSKAVQKHGIYLSDSELEMLSNMFAASDTATESNPTHEISPGDRLVALNYLLLHVNPRLSCAERLLCHKIRQTVRGYLQQQRKRKPADVLPPMRLFEKFDDAKCGRITRSEFRKCLSALGFDLLSVESEYRELVRANTKASRTENDRESLAASADPVPAEGTVNLDEIVLDDTVTKAAQEGRQQKGSKAEVIRSPTNVAQELAATQSIVPAATEFQRRKQAFMERMKAIASVSAKNLVYEQVQKKLQTQRTQVKTQAASQERILQQQIKSMHVPQNVHHDAARTLQRQYRHYKMLQKQFTRMKQARLSAAKSAAAIQNFTGRTNSTTAKYQTFDRAQNDGSNVIPKVTSPGNIRQRSFEKQHNAAQTLQRQYRQYRTHQKQFRREKQAQFTAAIHENYTEGDDDEEIPPCARDAVLRSLCNQMSSINFASQLDEVRDCLKQKDGNRSGNIKCSTLRQIFTQVGLSLSDDALKSLPMYFPGSSASRRKSELEAVVSYKDMLIALQATEEDRVSRNDPSDDKRDFDQCSQQQELTHKPKEITAKGKAPCTRDAILRSLCNQMSSGDFASRLDEVEEFLMQKDGNHTGSIKCSTLRKYFDRIGLSLSEDAFKRLQIHFPGFSAPGTKNQEAVISYTKMLMALRATKERPQERVRRNDPFKDERDSDQCSKQLGLTHKPERITAESKAPCTRDAILRSLYNRMSSIDFASQLDIVEEYLKENDCNRTGNIKRAKLKQIFNQLGLSLSEDAFESLQLYFPASNANDKHELVSFEKILLALDALHKQDEVAVNK